MMVRPIEVLSIDWDWFFPNVDDYDWGHREQLLFQSMLWGIRAGERNLFTKEWAIEAMLPNAERLDGFWERTVKGTPAWLMIVESHKDLYGFLKAIRKVVGRNAQVIVTNFDAHCDLYYGTDGPPTEKKKDGVQCDDWAWWAKQDKLMQRYLLVYPEWRKKPEMEMPDWAKVVKRPPAKTYTAIFICRSSAWTPSWADDQWIKFIGHWKRHDWVWKARTYCQFIEEERFPNLTQAYEERRKIVVMMRENARLNGKEKEFDEQIDPSIV